MRTYIRIVNNKGGIIYMTANEKELIKLIRENDNQGQALVAAVETILLYLGQHESFQEQVAVALRVQV